MSVALAAGNDGTGVVTETASAMSLASGANVVLTVVFSETLKSDSAVASKFKLQAVAATSAAVGSGAEANKVTLTWNDVPLGPVDDRNVLRSRPDPSRMRRTMTACPRLWCGKRRATGGNRQLWLGWGPRHSGAPFHVPPAVTLA